MEKHWSGHTFVEVTKSDTGRAGYCNICKGDMQQFLHKPKPSKFLHYKSHRYYRSVGGRDW